jgi:hypothetical protein
LVHGKKKPTRFPPAGARTTRLCDACSIGAHSRDEKTIKNCPNKRKHSLVGNLLWLPTAEEGRFTFSHCPVVFALSGPCSVQEPAGFVPPSRLLRLLRPSEATAPVSTVLASDLICVFGPPISTLCSFSPHLSLLPFPYYNIIHHRRHGDCHDRRLKRRPIQDTPKGEQISSTSR